MFACYLCWMWCLCLLVDCFGFAALVGVCCLVVSVNSVVHAIF